MNFSKKINIKSIFMHLELIQQKQNMIGEKEVVKDRKYTG